MLKVVRSATMLKLETNIDLIDLVHLASDNTKEQLATVKPEELATGKIEEELAAGIVEEFSVFCV